MPKQTLRERIRHAWNAFANRDPTESYDTSFGVSYYPRPSIGPRYFFGQDKSLVTSIINTIAIDCSTIDIKHCYIDENDKYISTIRSDLNDCLTVSANTDQTGRAFIIDLVTSLLEEGCVAVVPTDTSVDPNYNDSFKVYSLRVGKITEWYPTSVKVKLFRESTGQYEEVIMRKKAVAIIENPRYAVMNEPNSTLKRLMRKTNLLDSVDEQEGSKKLDVIVQVPYSVKSQAQTQHAEKRLKDIEMQLAKSEYGIAYTDATEKVVQLNRPVESNLQERIDKLKQELFSQLGLTEDVFNGTADEKTMLNFYNRTIEPILNAITDEFKRKFLTKTARTQGQSIMYFFDHFKLVPMSEMADIFDKCGRNGILTSNEMRAIMGLMPSSEPIADELVNTNNMSYTPQNPDGSVSTEEQDPMSTSINDL